MNRSRNHSRKRDALLDLLKCTDAHPTAEWIYERLKPEFPNLSLGTVYRNLAVLREEGRLISVGTVNGQERFDGNTAPHAHFICRRCGRVLDLPDYSLPENWQEAVKSCSGVPAESWDLHFTGVCADCAEAAGRQPETAPADPAHL